MEGNGDAVQSKARPDGFNALLARLWLTSGQYCDNITTERDNYMGLLSYIKDALSEPRGPVYTVRDLEEHWKDYRDCIINITESINESITAKGTSTIVDSYGNEESVGTINARIRWRYLSRIESWVDGEFIPKIREFSRIVAPRPGDKYPTWVLHKAQVGGNPGCNVHNNTNTARERAEHIVAALHFFLCDDRSPFDQRRSYNGGECSSLEAGEWYMNGKRIVERNIGRIEDSVAKIVRKGL